jgi:hypothetical protein
VDSEIPACDDRSLFQVSVELLDDPLHEVEQGAPVFVLHFPRELLARNFFPKHEGQDLVAAGEPVKMVHVGEVFADAVGNPQHHLTPKLGHAEKCTRKYP